MTELRSLLKGSWQAVGLTEGLYPRPVIAFTPFSWLPLFIRGAVTPKGFTGVTERIFVRITVALLSAQNLPRCEPRLSPPKAGCPHPSRCSAKAQHRATFPKGKAKRSRAVLKHFGSVLKYFSAVLRIEVRFCP